MDGFMLNVGNKICNVVPAGANADAATSIIFERGIFGIVTPLHHSKPSRKKPVLAQSVGRFTGTRKFSPETAARFARSTPKLYALNDVFGATIAPAQERSVRLGTFHSLNNGPTSEPLPNNIDSFAPFSHCANIMTANYDFNCKAAKLTGLN